MAESRGPLRRLEAGVLLPLAALLRRLGPRRRVAIGRRLGLLVHRVDAGHREVARRNLRQALGLDEVEAARLAREVFAHFGRVLAECLALPAYAAPGAAALFEVEGLEHLARAHARGRGVIVVSAHFGNWELIGVRQALAGYPMDFIARPLDNPWMEAALRKWREQVGNRVLGKHGALRQGLRTLREGRALAFMVDQSMRVPPRLFVPFFGRHAPVSPAMGHLAARTGAAVVPVVSFPRDDGGYRIVYEPELVAAPGSDPENAARELMRRATARVEDWVRQQPQAWLWMHDRWKWPPHPGEELL
ncbi:MAG: lysophospholipid acyltransferase family protein [Acidobacteria bacterium]|nr:lysophospholipid acyltransferase family protein [Acidobacteriota bacterium]